MPFKIEKVPGDFVGDFKVGDNLLYNSQLLCDLVQVNDAGRFNKAVVLQVGAILEAALSEIIYRAQNNYREGVPDMTEADRKEIEGKKIDKFNSVIDVMRKYHVLDRLGEDVYAELHKLRRHRNKVHIQDDVEGALRDEADIFVGELCDWALDLNSRVLRFLGENLKRPPHFRRHVADLLIPVPSVPNSERRS